MSNVLVDVLQCKAGNIAISTPAQGSQHYYSPRLPNDFTSMIFLHLVNLVTRTHETDETQWISFAAASRATCLVAVMLEDTGIA